MLFKTNWGYIYILVRDLAAFRISQETFTKLHSHVKQFTFNLKTKIGQLSYPRMINKRYTLLTKNYAFCKLNFDGHVELTSICHRSIQKPCLHHNCGNGGGFCCQGRRNAFLVHGFGLRTWSAQNVRLEWGYHFWKNYI